MRVYPIKLGGFFGYVPDRLNPGASWDVF